VGLPEGAGFGPGIGGIGATARAREGGGVAWRAEGDGEAQGDGRTGILSSNGVAANQRTWASPTLKRWITHGRRAPKYQNTVRGTCFSG